MDERTRFTSARPSRSRIRAYFLAGTGVTMNGLPRITSDSLVLSNLSPEPRQSAAEIRGQPYTMLTWNGVLTAVKEGAAKPEIELPVQLSYREAPRMQSFGGFGGAFNPGQQDPQGGQGSQDSPTIPSPRCCGSRRLPPILSSPRCSRDAIPSAECSPTSRVRFDNATSRCATRPAR